MVSSQQNKVQFLDFLQEALYILWIRSDGCLGSTATETLVKYQSGQATL